jgi:hypothetical protein
MEARFFPIIICACATLSIGAGHRSKNFVVRAQTDEFARSVCQAAEQYRRDLAIEWLGRELPDWPQPCPISVQAAPQLGAGGATSFAFDNGRPFGWTMSIQGSQQRILDSVLPHEITHTIFATHFGRPLPRWADEGACTTVEHVSERTKQHHLLIEALTTNRGIAFNRMFAMREYPPDMLPLYAQGYSLARFLVAQRGKQQFVRYVGDGMRDNDWPRATREHYGFRDLSDLQVSWLDWVRRGSSHQQARIMLASRMESTGSEPRPESSRPARPPESYDAPDPDRVRGIQLASNTSSRGASVPAVDDDSRVRGALPQSGDSWYARQGRQATSSGRSADEGHPDRNGIMRPDPAAPVFGRPPAPQAARQRVLEWEKPWVSRPGGTAATGGGSADAGQPMRFDAPPLRQSPTFLR